jgi:Flp pilus assembly protein TadB
MLSYVGWFATALFAGSYLFKEPRSLSIMQALAALVWIVYGVILGAGPVIVCNVAVALMASFAAYRFTLSRAEKKDRAPAN